MVINKGGKFLKNCGAASVGEYKCSDDGLTLETSAFKLFTVANLCFLHVANNCYGNDASLSSAVT